MPPGDVVIVGMGMMTAVGLRAAETAASVRAGVMRFTETPLMDKRFQPFTLAEVPEEGLPALAEALDRPGLTSRERRMLRLAMYPLLETLVALPPGQARPPLHLALPEAETTRPLDGPQFLEYLAAQVGSRFDVPRSDASLRGRAGGVQAVGWAAASVTAGQAPFALAGGVDSYRDLYVLGTLDMEGRVKSAENLDGFIPGEGASFVLLCSRSTAEAAGLAVLATISDVAEGVEAGHLYSAETYRGDGLAATIQALLQSGAASQPIQEVYASMNGESHWAKEWGVSFLRSRPAIREDHGMHHPADCYGDLGAAAGPAMVGLAAMGVRDAYRQPPCLVYGSSDRGGRAAILVST